MAELDRKNFIRYSNFFFFTNIKNKMARTHRYRPGTVALREIRRYQKSTDILFRRLPMQRLYRDVLKDMKDAFGNPVSGTLRLQSQALKNLDEIVQSFMISKYEAANECTIHAKRVTLMKKDLELIEKLGV